MKKTFKRSMLISLSFAVFALSVTAYGADCPNGQYLIGSPAVCKVPTPDEGKVLLEDGNSTFVAGAGALDLLTANASVAKRTVVAAGQKPFAIVLTCSDSRVPPEILFNKGLGEIFTVRVAGNVLDPHQLGSIEYAIEHLGVKLVVALGHEKCGAVKAAYDDHGIGTDLGPNLNHLISGIDASIGATIDSYVLANGTKPIVGSPAETALVQQCIVDNLSAVTASLKSRSTIIAEYADGNPAAIPPILPDTVKIYSAMYNLDTGAVTFAP